MLKLFKVPPFVIVWCTTLPSPLKSWYFTFFLFSKYEFLQIRIPFTSKCCMGAITKLYASRISPKFIGEDRKMILRTTTSILMPVGFPPLLAKNRKLSIPSKVPAPKS